MTENFDRAMEFVASWEGTFSDDAVDRGGATYMGISSHYWSEDFKAILALPPEERKAYATAFYRRNFWNAVGGDTLPYPMDIVAFDTAVNCGVSRAKAWMQASGGVWLQVLLHRIAYYAGRAKNETQRKFFRGWVNRVIDLWRTCAG